MTDPRSREEYYQRFRRNHRMRPDGRGGCHIIAPCPFCAAADFVAIPVRNMNNPTALAEADMPPGATCRECGRSIAFMTNLRIGQLEMVQTGGPEQPPWREPRMLWDYEFERKGFPVN